MTARKIPHYKFDIMRILFTMLRPFYPHFISGADVANFEYLASLVKRGAQCKVLGLKPFDDPTPLFYKIDGISVELYSTAQQLIDCTVTTIVDDKPDWVLTGCAGDRHDNSYECCFVNAIEKTGARAALLVRDIQETTAVYAGIYGVFSTFIANSEFTAREIKNSWAVDAHVVYSVPRPQRCRFAPLDYRGGHLTMFNPLQPKGIRTFLILAGIQLRDRQFLLVEGWLPFERTGIPQDRFPNITFQRRTDDIQEIYTRTDCLLVPSIWQEPFGRVVLEAMLNGLPVAASAVGGITEIMPDSPLLIQDYANPEAWALALHTLDDPTVLERHRQYSLKRASCFDHEREMDKLFQILESAH
ncbi:MAG: glycosyltransferase family 4 protein [Proteobacteria bacterium]|nr:glycosyltransferase family 4 protein [Pseudomonadota bacterium]